MTMLTHVMSRSCPVVSSPSSKSAMKRLITPLAAALIVSGASSFLPVYAQEPGFAAARSEGNAPGFEEQVVNFDLDAVKIKNARLDLTDSEDSAYLKKHHGLSLSSKEAIAFKGIFTTPSSADAPPQLLVVDLKEDQIRLYEGSSLLIRHKDLGLISTKEASALQLEQRVLIAQTTSDNTMDLVLWQKEAVTNSAGKKTGRTSYRMTVFKVFGKYFGRPFSQQIAYKKSDAKGGDIIPTATVSIYQKNDNLVFGVTPAKSERETLYIWDKWSGTFANPKLLPTATKKPHS